MPDIVRLRNVSGVPLEVAPLNDRTVGDGDTIDLAGRLLTEKDAAERGVDWPGDAYLIEAGNPPVVRAWPHAQWRTDGRAPRKASESTVTTDKE